MNRSNFVLINVKLVMYEVVEQNPSWLPSLQSGATGCYPTVLRCIYYAGIIVSSGCVLTLNLAFIADKDPAEYILCLTNTLFIITPYNTAPRDNKLADF